MNRELRQFLEAGDLDQLLVARSNIRLMAAPERESVEAILAGWSDTQAVSNLLMYPEVIPQNKRLDTVMRGLNSTGYPGLAAVVGLQHLSDDELPDDVRVRVAARLVELARQSQGILAARASAALPRFAADLAPEQLLSALAHSDDRVKHNALLSLLEIMGAEEIRAAVQANVQAGRLDAGTERFVAARLGQLYPDNSQASAEAADAAASMLAVPVLGYIPNYAEWAEFGG